MGSLSFSEQSTSDSYIANEFDAIRSYTDQELPAAFTRIMASKEFSQVLHTIYPADQTEGVLHYLKHAHSVHDFQKDIMLPYLRTLEKKLTTGIVCEGLDNTSHSPACLYISNHRDITLDPALLCKCLLEANKETVEIGIGDNLLIYPWIEDFVRINRSFIVKRGGGARELLHNSKRLSSYIHRNIVQQQHSVWIAQREGRAKDSNDRTQESLLKMLAMAGKGLPASSLQELNICPLTISYEYDPCDYLKAKEFQQKRDDSDFKKSRADDLANMRVGVMGYKGGVVFRFLPNINPFLQTLQTQVQDKNQQIAAIAHYIDQQIHRAYEIYPCNKIAYDLLYSGKRFAQEYTAAEQERFERYVQQQTDKIELPNKDETFLRTKLLEMYSNPLKNYLAAIQA